MIASSISFTSSSFSLVFSPSSDIFCWIFLIILLEFLFLEALNLSKNSSKWSLVSLTPVFGDIFFSLSIAAVLFTSAMCALPTSDSAYLSHSFSGLIPNSEAISENICFAFNNLPNAI